MARPYVWSKQCFGELPSLGLLVERKEPGGFDRLGEFSNFGRLARLHCLH